MVKNSNERDIIERLCQAYKCNVMPMEVARGLNNVIATTTTTTTTTHDTSHHFVNVNIRMNQASQSMVQLAI